MSSSVNFFDNNDDDEFTEQSEEYNEFYMDEPEIYMSDGEHEISCCPTNSRSVLDWAVRRNYIKVIDALLHENAHITLQMIAEDAAYHGRLNILKYAFWLGAKPSHEILKMACTKGSESMVRFLHEKIKHLLKKRIVQQLIQIAVDKGHLKLIKFFMEIYPGVLKNYRWDLSYIGDNGYGESFAYGEAFVYLDIVKLLVEQGDANIHDNRNYLVFRAIRGGHLSLVKYLVSRGANIFDQGDYAIENVKYRDHNMVKYLLEKGANPEKVPKWYKAPESGVNQKLPRRLYSEVVRSSVDKNEQSKILAIK
jgi:ankyrin repeat protein